MTVATGKRVTLRGKLQVTGLHFDPDKPLIVKVELDNNELTRYRLGATSINVVDITLLQVDIEELLDSGTGEVAA